MKITLRVLSENPHIPQPKFKPKLLANQRSLTGHSLVIQGLQNDKDTLHEFMKIPGTHSKKSVFFLSDSLGSPYLTIPPPPAPPHTGTAGQGGTVSPLAPQKQVPALFHSPIPGPGACLPHGLDP